MISNKGIIFFIVAENSRGTGHQMLNNLACVGVERRHFPHYYLQLPYFIFAIGTIDIVSE